MSKSRIAALSLLFCLAFTAVVHAQGDSDAKEANLVCKEVGVQNNGGENKYESSKPWDKLYEENKKKYFNNYGTKCVDKEGANNADIAAEGYCVAAKTCKATKCAGTTCKLPDLKVDESKNPISGGDSDVPDKTNAEYLDNINDDGPPVEPLPSDSANKISEAFKEAEAQDQPSVFTRARDAMGDLLEWAGFGGDAAPAPSGTQLSDGDGVFNQQFDSVSTIEPAGTGNAETSQSVPESDVYFPPDDTFGGFEQPAPPDADKGWAQTARDWISEQTTSAMNTVADTWNSYFGDSAGGSFDEGGFADVGDYAGNDSDTNAGSFDETGFENASLDDSIPDQVAEGPGKNTDISPEDWVPDLSDPNTALNQPEEQPATAPQESKSCSGYADCLAANPDAVWGNIGPTTAAQEVKPEIKPIGEETFNVTAYFPCTSAAACPVQGGPASSVPGPDGKSLVRTLEDYRLGRSEHVTAASDKSRYGENYVIPEITYRNSLGETHTLTDVPVEIHDTGSAFRGRPDKIDIPVEHVGSESQARAAAVGQPFLSQSRQTFTEVADISNMHASAGTPNPWSGQPYTSWNDVAYGGFATPPSSAPESDFGNPETDYVAQADPYPVGPVVAGGNLDPAIGDIDPYPTVAVGSAPLDPVVDWDAITMVAGDNATFGNELALSSPAAWEAAELGNRWQLAEAEAAVASDAEVAFNAFDAETWGAQAQQDALADASPNTVSQEQLREVIDVAREQERDAAIDRVFEGTEEASRTQEPLPQDTVSPERLAEVVDMVREQESFDRALEEAQQYPVFDNWADVADASDVVDAETERFARENQDAADALNEFDQNAWWQQAQQDDRLAQAERDEADMWADTAAAENATKVPTVSAAWTGMSIANIDSTAAQGWPIGENSAGFTAANYNPGGTAPTAANWGSPNAGVGFSPEDYVGPSLTGVGTSPEDYVGPSIAETDTPLGQGGIGSDSARAPNQQPAADAYETLSAGQLACSGGGVCGDGTRLEGRRMANGERFDSNEKTVAVPRNSGIPLGSTVRVENVETGQSTEARVTDYAGNNGRIGSVSQAVMNEIGGDGLVNARITTTQSGLTSTDGFLGGLTPADLGASSDPFGDLGGYGAQQSPPTAGPDVLDDSDYIAPQDTVADANVLNDSDYLPQQNALGEQQSNGMQLVQNITDTIYDWRDSAIRFGQDTYSQIAGYFTGDGAVPSTPVAGNLDDGPSTSLNDYITGEVPSTDTSINDYITGEIPVAESSLNDYITAEESAPASDTAEAPQNAPSTQETSSQGGIGSDSARAPDQWARDGAPPNTWNPTVAERPEPDASASAPVPTPAEQAAMRQQAVANLVRSNATAMNGLQAMQTSQDERQIAAGKAAASRMLQQAKAIGDQRLVSDINSYLSAQRRLEQGFAIHGRSFVLLPLYNTVISSGNRVTTYVQTRYGGR